MNFQDSAPAVTRQIADLASERKFEQIPLDILRLVRQCVLDLLGVTIAGHGEPAVDLLIQDALEEAAAPAHGLIARKERLSLYRAAQVNGFIAHVLDYDDVHMTMEGHPTVAILPALLSLGEAREASGAELAVAFLAGYEAACQIGAFLGPVHYARGFHNTATVGAMAAAVGAARLLRLDGAQTANAIGIAATQAAGLKIMFGTMCKPLHAGEANRVGLFAAMMSRRGFIGCDNALEARHGFAEAHGSDRAAMPDLAEEDFHIRGNLFKYHASCYKTHAPIEAARLAAQGAGLRPEAVAEAALTVDPSLDMICNIAEPRTGLEAKFSLRHTTALALLGADTAQLDTFGDVAALDQATLGMRAKVAVAFAPMNANRAEIRLRLADGTERRASCQSDRPNSDLADQQARLEAKFMSLVEPVFGRARAETILAEVNNLEHLPSVGRLMALVARS